MPWLLKLLQKRYRITEAEAREIDKLIGRYSQIDWSEADHAEIDRVIADNYNRWKKGERA